MNANSIEERKRYISEIKASFGDPQKSHQYGKLDTQEEKGESTSYFKLKAILAILIFAAFVYCDRYHVTVFEQNTSFIYEKLEETIPIEKWIQSLENML